MTDRTRDTNRQARRCTYCGDITYADVGAARCPENGNVLTRYEPVDDHKRVPDTDRKEAR